MPDPAVPTQHILVVEDEEDQRELVAALLRREGHHVRAVASVAAALEEMDGPAADLVLSDWRLPDGDGMDLLARVRERAPGTAFIMVTAYGTINHAVEAVRAGADDYLTKPFEGQALLLAMARTLRSRRLEDENRRLAADLGDRDRLVELVGRAPAMQQLYRRVEKVAGTDATVLISGESGTGKELAARALHALSRRAGGPFVAVNCAAIPEGLIESEFFGAEKGAYTGADRQRPGTFQTAQGGTLFLDEVGELPLPLQPKLLRALQERKITPVGGAGEIPIDVRIVAATNRELAADVAAGRFREDLYYRLNVVPMRMPPLRERREDVPRLIQHFLERARRRHSVEVGALPAGVVKRLVEHAWPGNVRELENAMERLVLLAEGGEVHLEDLPGDVAGGRAPDGGFRLPAGGLSWAAHERSCLAQALYLSGGNRARAARLLDMPYKAFLYRLSKHGLAGAGGEPGD